MSESYLTKPPQKYLMDGTKYLYHQDRLEDYLRGNQVNPITIDMGIHKACNIKCVYCYGVKQGKTAEFIPEDRLIMLAEDASKTGVRGIAIIGDGEPTMNKGLYPFVRELRDRGVDSLVATNGLLLDNEKISILTANCKCIRYNISGVSNYEWVMGAPRGSFTRFKKIIQDAVRYGKFTGCTIGLQAVLIPECFNEIIPLTQFALDNGVDYLVIKQFSDGGAGMPMHFNMEEYKNAEETLRRASSMGTDNTKIIVKWEAIKDTTNITMGGHYGFDKCNDLPFLFQISGNGGCYPCGYHFGNPEYCYGNIRNQRLSEILQSEKYWRIIAKCAETPLKELCKGQCRHCESLKFLDKLNKIYDGDLQKALIEMCGSKEQYELHIKNPPEHLNFL